jgi:hypothetical protein
MRICYNRATFKHTVTNYVIYIRAHICYNMVIWCGMKPRVGAMPRPAPLSI